MPRYGTWYQQSHYTFHQNTRTTIGTSCIQNGQGFSIPNYQLSIRILALPSALHAFRMAKAFQSQITNKCHQLHAKCVSTMPVISVSGEAKEDLFVAGVDVKRYSRLLTACADMKDLTSGRKLHTHLIKTGIEVDPYLDTGLAIMYVKNGKIEDARQMFDKMPERNVVSWTGIIAGYARNSVSWNTMIAGYARDGKSKEAIKCFAQMQSEGLEPRESTFVPLLSACAGLGEADQGREVHACVIKTGFNGNVIVNNALITMYAKCGSVEDSCIVFDRMPERNVVSWTAMISGYAQNGRIDEALQVFEKMPERNVVSWNAIISGCAKNGRFEDARRLFAEMSNRNVVTWNGKIAGYAKNAYGEEALKLFQWEIKVIMPDIRTFSIVLQACANLAAMEKGKQIHSHIIRLGFEADAFIGSALVDMYAKSGSIIDARQFFEKMPEQNLVSWNAMIIGFAQHGHGSEALHLFEVMQHEGLKPDAITFVGVLIACSSEGFVDQGWRHFNSMWEVHHIKAGKDHYACMVDLLGHAGRLDEAEDLINIMPFEPDVVIWRVLLGACKIHANLELCVRVAGHLLELEPKSAANYVLLANSYAAAGRWDDVGKVRMMMMRDRRIKKDPGCSWIEFQNRVHTFVVDDTSHPQTLSIYTLLEKLTEQIKEAGYVPETNSVLHDVEGERKEQLLCYHSEKLAIAFGIINFTPGTTIRVIKNHRMCGDCHTATKFISKVVGREIVVRDVSRFHHFIDGFCSYKDYW